MGKHENKRGKAVIFDLDGTLWDSSETVSGVWTKIFNKHGNENISAAELRCQMGRPVEDIIDHFVPGLDRKDLLALVKECSSAENEYISEHGGILFPGVRDVIEILHSGYFIGLVSNCQEGYAKAFIEYYDMGGLFDDYEEAGRTGRSKAQNIAQMIKRNGLDEVIYVGDTSWDKKSAEEAGVVFIYASYGFGNLADVIYEIDHIRDLPQLVNKIFRK